VKLDQDTLRGLGKASGFGLTMAVSMAFFGWVGSRIDVWLNTAPIFTVIFFLAGGAVAMAYGIINFLK